MHSSQSISGHCSVNSTGERKTLVEAHCYRKELSEREREGKRGREEFHYNVF